MFSARAPGSFTCDQSQRKYCGSSPVSVRGWVRKGGGGGSEGRLDSEAQALKSSGTDWSNSRAGHRAERSWSRSVGRDGVGLGGIEGGGLIEELDEQLALGRSASGREGRGFVGEVEVEQYRGDDGG